MWGKPQSFIYPSLNTKTTAQAQEAPSPARITSFLTADKLTTHSKLTFNYGQRHHYNPQHCGLVGFGNRETNYSKHTWPPS